MPSILASNRLIMIKLCYVTTSQYTQLSAPVCSEARQSQIICYACNQDCNCANATNLVNYTRVSLQVKLDRYRAK